LLWHKHHHLAAQPAHVFPPYPFKCHSKRERMQYAIPWKYVPLLGPCSESDCFPVVCEWVARRLPNCKPSQKWLNCHYSHYSNAHSIPLWISHYIPLYPVV
jgi:hypothetical protein